MNRMNPARKVKLAAPVVAPVPSGVRLVAPAVTARHAQLSIGDSSTDPEGADLTVSLGDPGSRLPGFVARRLGREGLRFGDGLVTHREDTLSIGAYPTSTGEGRMFRGMLHGALRAARPVLDQGGTVHLNCGSGRVRSVTLLVLLLSELEEDLSGESLLQRAVDLRPEALGGLDGQDGSLALLSVIRPDLEYRRDLDFSEVRNLRWV